MSPAISDDSRSPCSISTWEVFYNISAARLQTLPAGKSRDASEYALISPKRPSFVGSDVKSIESNRPPHIH